MVKIPVEGKKMSFTGQFFSSALTQAVTLILGLVSSILLVRYLGADGNGIYSLAVLMSTVITVLLGGGGGLQGANPYWVRKKPSEANIVFTNSLLFGFVVFAVLVLSYYLTKGFPLTKFLPADIILLLILAVPALLLQQYNQGILWGLDRINQHNLISAARGLVLVGVNLVILVWFKGGVKEAVAGWLAASIMIMLISIYVVYNAIGKHLIKADAAIFIRSAGMALKGVLVDAVSFIGTRIDAFLIMYFLGPAQVSYYLIAILVAEITNLVPSAVGRLIFNRAVAPKENSVSGLARAGRLCMAYSIATCIFLLIFSKYPILLFYGKDFAGSFYCLIFLFPGIISQNMNATIYNFLNAREGYPLFCISTNYFIFLLNLLLNFLLIPSIGIIGAAISYSIAHTIRMLMLSAYMFLKTGLNFTKFMVLQKEDISVLLKNMRIGSTA
jgi:O-antigen/teichoic acid export membrane protein